MLELLARKSATGEASVNLAEQYLANHEWGLAKEAIEQALAKGGLLDIDYALRLLTDACHRMGVRVESDGRNLTP